MNFFSAIGHFFKHIAVFVSDAFIKLFGSDAAHNFAVAAESLLNTALGKIAWLAVQEVEGLATGAEKYAAAFAKITEGAKVAGIEAGTSLINMLIEIAVQKIKGNYGPAPISPASPAPIGISA